MICFHIYPLISEIAMQKHSESQKINESEEQDSPLFSLPPGSFVESLINCLRHLYDLPYLQKNPIIISPDKVIVGQALRQELIFAIEAMNPEGNISTLSNESRTYNLLHLRYIQKKSIKEITQFFGISNRQAYRDLRKSEQNLCATFWERNSGSVDSDNQINISDTQSDISIIEPVFQSTDLIVILQNAIQTTRTLSLKQATPIILNFDKQPSYVFLEETIAYQVLVSLISFTVRKAHIGSDIKINVTQTASQILIDFAFQQEEKGLESQIMDDLILQLLKRLGWQLDISDYESCFQNFRLSIPCLKIKILIVDDNEGLVALLTRHLADQAYGVYSTTKATECIKLAQELSPDIIILDIMLPEINGWDLLQQIKINPQTKHIHVIICSVMKEPELAKSLGASAYLAKPIRKSELLATIQKLSQPIR